MHAHLYKVLYIEVKILGFNPGDTMGFHPAVSRLIQPSISLLVAFVCTNKTRDQSRTVAGVFTSHKREPNRRKEKACVVGGR